MRVFDDGEIVAEVVPEVWMLRGYGPYPDAPASGRVRDGSAEPPKTLRDTDRDPRSPQGDRLVPRRCVRHIARTMKARVPDRLGQSILINGGAGGGLLRRPARRDRGLQSDDIEN